MIVFESFVTRSFTPPTWPDYIPGGAEQATRNASRRALRGERRLGMETREEFFEGVTGNGIERTKKENNQDQMFTNSVFCLLFHITELWLKSRNSLLLLSRNSFCCYALNDLQDNAIQGIATDISPCI